MAVHSILSTPSRRVLVAVEDPSFGEMLLDALAEAGHLAELAVDEAGLRAALARPSFDVALVDLDNRGRNGAQLVALVRERSPSTTVVALLPCGGLPPNHPEVQFDASVEKPGRLLALLSALAAAHGTNAQ